MNKTTNMTRSSLCGLVCLSLLERRVDLPAALIDEAVKSAKVRS